MQIMASKEPETAQAVRRCHSTFGAERSFSASSGKKRSKRSRVLGLSNNSIAGWPSCSDVSGRAGVPIHGNFISGSRDRSERQ